MFELAIASNPMHDDRVAISNIRSQLCDENASGSGALILHHELAPLPYSYRVQWPDTGDLDLDLDLVQIHRLTDIRFDGRSLGESMCVLRSLLGCNLSRFAVERLQMQRVRQQLRDMLVQGKRLPRSGRGGGAAAPRQTRILAGHQRHRRRLLAADSHSKLGCRCRPCHRLAPGMSRPQRPHRGVIYLR